MRSRQTALIVFSENLNIKQRCPESGDSRKQSPEAVENAEVIHMYGYSQVTVLCGISVFELLGVDGESAAERWRGHEALTVFFPIDRCRAFQGQINREEKRASIANSSK